MLCPDDGSELVDDAVGGASCRRCRGRAVTRARFFQARVALRRELRAEEDARSGAFARLRPCPRCHRPMVPLRIADQAAWLEACEACDVLWVEKLDEAVLRRVERRTALRRAVDELPPEARREMARDLAGEMVRSDRTVRVLRAIRKLLAALTGW